MIQIARCPHCGTKTGYQPMTVAGDGTRVRATQAECCICGKVFDVKAVEFLKDPVPHAEEFDLLGVD